MSADDDAPIGRILSRREMLALFGGAGAALLVACTRSSDQAAVPSATAGASTMPACVVRPESTEGPFFVDEKLNRSDIRAGREGLPLVLTFVVSQISSEGGCVPLEAAQVDVWHCDAEGVYSDVSESSDTKFLRGYQMTDADGMAKFTTIYPGWYQGRAVHIHFKIRKNGNDFTSQLYFDDAISDEVYSNPPYAARGQNSMGNDEDGIFGRDGASLLLDLKKSGAGYTATFPIGLQT